MSAFQILRFERLREPPRCPGLDQVWWEAQVGSQSASYKVYLWVDSGAARSIPGDPDQWVLGELEKLARHHSPVGKLYAYSPFELTP